MKTSTVPVSAPAWLTIDATGHTIGQVATAAVRLLRGKHKASFSPHQLCGDVVIVLNTDKLRIAAPKLLKKEYKDHTGHPGGLSVRTLARLMESGSTEVIERAVKGMLTNNRLRREILKRLHVFAGSDHPFAAQKPKEWKMDNV